MCITLFGLGVVVGAVYGGVRWLTTSDRFAIDAIRLEGQSQQGEEVLRDLLAPTLGHNLFVLDTHAVEERVTQLPWVSSATVERVLPNQLTIHLREHQAAGVVAFESLYLVDDAGKPFKRCDVPRGECDGLTLINGLSRDTYRTHRERTEAAIRRGLAVADLYASGRDRPALGEIFLDAQRGVEIVTAEGAARIVLGHGEMATYESRLDRFDIAWAELDEHERSAASRFFIHGETRNHNVIIATGNRYAANGQD